MLPLAKATETQALIIGLVILGVFFLILLVLFLVVARFVRTWMRAALSGAPVSVLQLLGMRARKLPLATILDAYIRLKSAGCEVGLEALEKHHLAGGDVRRVADWLVATQAAGLDSTWDQLAKADLAKSLPDVGDVAGQEPGGLAAALQASAQGEQSA